MTMAEEASLVEYSQREPRWSAIAAKQAQEFVIFLLVVLLLAVTNPAHESHKQAIRDDVFRQAPLFSMLGFGRLVAWMTEYRSLVVISYTTVDGRLASVGALGQVWIAPNSAVRSAW